jgi:transglutaminase-like putative cysteine protease
MRFSRWLLLFLWASWALVALYPDPGVLVESTRNLLQPRIQPQAVAALAATMPNDPRVIEQRVLDQVVPYAYDWQTAGVPWYFPTTAQALQQGRGDCESRAVVLASILAAKHIPYQLRMSFDHIWVQYPGKQPNALENNGVVLAERRNGHFIFRWPSQLNWAKEWDAQVAIYWTPMPASRKVLLLAGILTIPLWNVLAGYVAAWPADRRRRRAILLPVLGERLPSGGSS